ncbi:hypothetical protein [Paenibacillus sanguinis]|uniref:hypothetical protein n=1 Tax=Paenibacillus sanguinis TaxID=225906 RepID=UPI00036654B9|nr:hypothetical protein [Paenibacillus sanguinis]
MIRMFRSKDYVQAHEFIDFSSIQPIIQLTGMGITVDFSNTGDLQSITLKNGTTTIVAAPGQFIYKTNTGTVGVCELEWLQDNYVEDPPVIGAK